MPSHAVQKHLPTQPGGASSVEVYGFAGYITSAVAFGTLPTAAASSPAKSVKALTACRT